MHIECFAYFYKVAMAKSISKVAATSHISQSALSQQLQKLEESLGFQLLKRSNKGVELTEEGHIVLQYADNMVRTYNKMTEELSNHDKHSQKLQIEACWPIAVYALPCTLYDMKKKHNNHTYGLRSNSSSKIEQNILNNISDIGFTYNRPKDLEISYTEVGYDDIVLVAPGTYNIDQEISIEELFDHPMVLLNDNLNLQETLEMRLRDQGFELDRLNILFDIDSAEAVKSSLFQGHGLSFLPYLSVKKELYRKQLKLVKIKELAIRYPIYLLYKRHGEGSPVRDFVATFQEKGKRSFC